MTEENGSHWCRVNEAPKFLEWILNRGGLAIWESVNINSPDQKWATPFLLPDGTRTPPPHYFAEPEPAVVYKDPKDVLVAYDQEVERFKVGVERSVGGWRIVDPGVVHAAIERAGDGAYYQFDYDTQEAVILAPVKVVTLAEWRTAAEGPPS